MAPQLHTALLDLPDVLDGLGLNVELEPEWQYGQCEPNNHYLWTSPYNQASSHEAPPSGYMVHHTASSEATPPPALTSKANAWAGLKRGHRLYQDGGGEPTVVLSTAGPARISSGYGYRPAAWEHTFLDKRAPTWAEGPDGETALNRYVFNLETVHRGDGSDIDAGVWEHVVGLGIALHDMFGWTERTLGHLSWSQRKIDPYWNGDTAAIVAVQDAIAKGVDMDLETWAATLRNPQDFDQMAAKGVITAAELDYWKAQPLYLDPPTNQVPNPEFQDLRNAVTVRNPLWT